MSTARSKVLVQPPSIVKMNDLNTPKRNYYGVASQENQSAFESPKHLNINKVLTNPKRSPPRRRMIKNEFQLEEDNGSVLSQNSNYNHHPLPIRSMGTNVSQYRNRIESEGGQLLFRRPCSPTRLTVDSKNNGKGKITRFDKNGALKGPRGSINHSIHSKKQLVSSFNSDDEESSSSSLAEEKKSPTKKFLRCSQTPSVKNGKISVQKLEIKNGQLQRAQDNGQMRLNRPHNQPSSVFQPQGRGSLFNQGGKKIGMILLQAIHKKGSLPLKLGNQQREAVEKNVQCLKGAFERVEKSEVEVKANEETS